mgnify:CR=1 FL=1
MLVADAGRLSPADEMDLEVLLKSTVCRSIILVIELPEVLLGELACITVGDGTTPDAIEDFFIRGWIIGGFSHSRGDNAVKGRGNIALCRRDLLLSVGRIEGLFEAQIIHINGDEGSLSIDMGSFYVAITNQHPSCRVRFIGGSEILELKGGFVSVVAELFVVQLNSSGWNQSRRI